MPKALLKEIRTLARVLKRAKYIIVAISIATAVSVCSSSVIAGAGLVSSVGGVTFPQGTKQFWVSTTKPTLSGIASASSNVDVTIGKVKNTVKSDASGNWSYTPATDLSGDNQVIVATASTSTTFTLTIGVLPANIASASGGTLAPAGTINPTLFILAGGFALLAIGGFGLVRKS